MKNKIASFLKNGKQNVLLLEYGGDNNILYEWHKIRNPLKIIFNRLIIKICKNLPPRMKVFPLRFFLGIKIGKNVGIAPDTEFEFFFPELISIDNDAIIGLKVNIVCHEFTTDSIRLGRIHIGKESLIGAFSTIRSGVTIGNNSIVAACSLVNRNVPNFELWGGVPAKRIKKLK